MLIRAIYDSHGFLQCKGDALIWHITVASESRESIPQSSSWVWSVIQRLKLPSEEILPTPINSYPYEDNLFKMIVSSELTFGLVGEWPGQQSRDSDTQVLPRGGAICLK